MTKKDDIPEISHRIKQLREDRGLSQKELGKLVGVTDAAVTYWENGDRFPRGVHLKKLAEALGVTESAILDGAKGSAVKIPGKAVTKEELIGQLILLLPALNQTQIMLLIKLATKYIRGSNSNSVDSTKING